MSVTQKKLKLGDFTKEENQIGIETPILTFKVPRGQVFFLNPSQALRLFIPIYEDVAHGGTGEETLSVSNNIVNNDKLSDDGTVVVRVASDLSKTSGGLVSVDYATRSINKL